LYAKKTWKVLNKTKKNIDLNYVDFFYYKFIVITKVYFFQGNVNTTHINETSLLFAIYYSKSQWKRNNLLILVSYTKSKTKGLNLISKIVINPKWRKKRGREPWLASIRLRQEWFKIKYVFFLTQWLVLEDFKLFFS
jgi:hypothetical protein